MVQCEPVTPLDGRCSTVQAAPSTAMTGQSQEPELDEPQRCSVDEEGDEEEEGDHVHVSVEKEELGQEHDLDLEKEEKEELPYPSLAPVVLLALTQHSPPRSWCLRAVCHPYPSL
uniref:Uncharacterized protein n=1 Tax=Knipowitschia caucasica TaxID=637954 RepID=A0AAV2LL23_KNICA